MLRGFTDDKRNQRLEAANPGIGRSVIGIWFATLQLARVDQTNILYSHVGAESCAEANCTGMGNHV